MIRDLRTILDGWDYEPGRISVRKIIGREGRQKIQTRADLGVLQLECAGRPDGQRPRECDSLLDYHERRLQQHISAFGDDSEFVLSPEQCQDLRYEAHMYYQRFLALFVLEEFDGVERDAARNLRVMDLCARYAAAEEDRRALETQRAYVMMMHVRGRAYRALVRGDCELALEMVDDTIAAVRALPTLDGAETPLRSELSVLAALRDEVIQQLPLDSAARLRVDLALALECEDYELAARIRDRLERVSGAGVDAASRQG